MFWSYLGGGGSCLVGKSGVRSGLRSGGVPSSSNSGVTSSASSGWGGGGSGFNTTWVHPPPPKKNVDKILIKKF